MPLVHPPGHTQADFGGALAMIGGERKTIHLFCFDLPHSDACFVKAYPAERTVAFLDGHNAAFSFLGGVPLSILYDDTKLAVVSSICTGVAQVGASFLHRVQTRLTERGA